MVLTMMAAAIHVVLLSDELAPDKGFPPGSSRTMRTVR